MGADQFSNLHAKLNAMIEVMRQVNERLDRIEAAMLKREDLHFSNRSRPVDDTHRDMEEWKKIMAGEHREGGE